MSLLLPYKERLKKTEVLRLISLSLFLVINLPVQAYILAPVVDLGPDTSTCNTPLLLDAGNSGASFNWSTGESSQTITVSNSGIYWVDVTDGSETTRDSIEVRILPDLPAPVLSDTVICEGESLSFSLASMGDGVIWFDSPSGGNVITSGFDFERTPSSTETLYASYYSNSKVSIGMADTTFGTINYVGANGWGENFDVISPYRLEAVHTYASAAVSFDLVIEDPNGTTIFQQTYSLNNSFVRSRLDVGIDLDIGQGYQMKAMNFSGQGGLAVSFPSSPSHPFEIPGLAKINSGIVPAPVSRYFYFYDWELGQPSCFSPRAPMQITVNPSPTVNLGNDTVICQGAGTPLVLDASNAGASYLWSDGSQNSNFSIQSTDTVSVLVTIGDCLASDEISVYVFDVPTDPGPRDSSICGIQEISLTNSQAGNVAYSFWWDENDNFVLENPIFQEFLRDTTQLFLQSVNTRSFRMGITNFVQSFNARLDLFPRGHRINAYQDILIRSLAIYPVSTNDMQLDLVVKDSNGSEIIRKTFNLSPPYNREVLNADLLLPQGNGYSLELENIVGGALYRENLTENIYPLRIDGLAEISSSTINGTDNLTQYNYFYDLEVIGFSSSCASGKISQKINVTFPFDFQDSIYSCTDLVLDPQVSANSYNWNTGANSPSINVSETGTYILILNDGQGCEVIDSSFIEIPRDAGLDEDGILCGNSLFTDYHDASQFNWSTGANTSSIQISNPGTYWVEVTEPRGCVLTDTIVVTGFDSFPVVDLGSDKSGCESISLDAGNPGLNFLWSTGETDQQINVTSSGLYSVIVSNSNNCQAFDTVGVSVIPNPTAQFSVPDTVIGGVSRRVNFINQSSFGSYLWKFGDGNTSTQISPSYTYADTGTYCVDLIVTDVQANCGSDTSTKCILVLQYPVGIDEEILGAKVTIYPIPVQDELIIERDTYLAESWDIQILNLQGKVLAKQIWNAQMSALRYRINLTLFPPGIYLISISNSTGSIQKKLSIQP